LRRLTPVASHFVVSASWQCVSESLLGAGPALPC
jgi:hypothetical protein